MNNVSSMLSTHNKNILNPKQTSFGCNCGTKSCSHSGDCLTPNIIYRADITTDNNYKLYYVTSGVTFKSATAIILVTSNMPITNMILNLLNTSSS